MARIRSIKPEFFRHSGLYDAEHETGLPLRVAFAGLWTVADREGRFRWKPREIKLDILPYDKVDISRVLDALTTRGFIEKYACDGVEYGCIPSWSKHQVINNRESASTIPEKPQLLLLEAPNDACGTREARVTDLHVHASGEGEGKGRGKEGEGEGSTPPPKRPEKTEVAERVRLSQEEHEKLKAEFGEAGAAERIEKLSLYKGSTGKKYASDYLTILSWSRRDGVSKTPAKSADKICPDCGKRYVGSMCECGYSKGVHGANV